MAPKLSHLDHIVLTVKDITATIAFYEAVLGMEGRRFKTATGEERWSLAFGAQKINLHQSGAEFDPKAAYPGPGTADLCFLSDTPLDDWMTHLGGQKIAIEIGPVPRTGATGPLRSIYLRDPDGNLIEVANAV